MFKGSNEPKMKQFYRTFVIIIVWFGMDINDYLGTTAIWVSLEGCYITVRQNSSLNLIEKNGPRRCFDACPNSTYIGLQDSWCMCDIIGENYALPKYCNSPCSGESDMLCGSHPGIAVFSKVNPAESISVSGDFGCVYVHVSVPLGSIGHNLRLQATNNCSEEHFYAYFDDLNSPKCLYERALETWFKARDKFVSLAGNKFLLPQKYVRDDICPPQAGQGIDIDHGEFWIGMIWITTDITTTSMTTQDMISTQLTQSTTATIQLITKDQSTKRTTATSSTIFSTTQSSSSSIDLIAVYIVVPVGVCVVSAVVIVICWCQKLCCFRSCREGVETDKTNYASALEIPDVNPSEAINVSSRAQPGSTGDKFKGHPENVIPTISGHTDIQGVQYIEAHTEKSDRDMGIITPNHLEGLSIKPGTSYIELNDETHSAKSRRKQKKAKRRKKSKEKENQCVRGAIENREIDGNTDNHAGIDRYVNGDLSVVNDRTEDLNVESKDHRKKTKEKKKKQQRDYSYAKEERTSTPDEPFATVDPGPQFYRSVTASDINASVPAIQENNTNNIDPSKDAHNESNANKSDCRIEKTKKDKKSTKKSKGKEKTVFDIPAEDPVVEAKLI